MSKIDYISGTEGAYVKEGYSMVRVQVSGPPRESEKSFGVLVDLTFDEKGRCNSAMRLEWFPKSLCTVEEVKVYEWLPAYFLTAPEWLLDKKNVKYDKSK